MVVDLVVARCVGSEQAVRMPTFRVMVRGEAVGVTFDEGPIPCGFFKNVYIWASDAEKARARAFAAVLADVRTNPAINREDVSSLRLEVDELERAGVTSLLRRQGLVFYPIDTEE